MEKSSRTEDAERRVQEVLQEVAQLEEQASSALQRASLAEATVAVLQEQCIALQVCALPAH